jgi:hypothetical protein
MRPVVLAIFMAVFTASVRARAGAHLPADPGPPTPEQLAAGQELADRLRSAAPTENSQEHGKLIIKANGVTTEIPITCEVILHGTNWETDYETEATAQRGPERLVVIHSTNGPSQYLFARAASPAAPLPRLEPVPPSAASIPLAGSDYALDDLGLEFLHWPVQRQLHDEGHLGQACYVLECSNPSGREIVRVKADIDKDSGGLLVADAYDAKGTVVKEFSLGKSSFTKINGHWHLEKMDIRNKKTGSHTEIKFDMIK